MHVQRVVRALFRACPRFAVGVLGLVAAGRLLHDGYFRLRLAVACSVRAVALALFRHETAAVTTDASRTLSFNAEKGCYLIDYT